MTSRAERSSVETGFPSCTEPGEINITRQQAPKAPLVLMEMSQVIGFPPANTRTHNATRPRLGSWTRARKT